MRNLLLIICVYFSLLMPYTFAQETKGIEVVGASAPVPPAQAINSYAGSYALLIGVSDYTNGWTDLNSVQKELDSVERALIKAHFDKVIRVKDPTEKELKSALDDFSDKYGYDENNRLFFFYSGHGYSAHGEDVGYLVPTDAANPLKDERGFFSKAVTMEEIITFSKKIKSKHALFMFDSCFSGTIFQTRAMPQVTPLIEGFLQKPVRQFITAGSANEEVPARSVFIPAFIKAIEGSGDLNKDGFVTGSELGMYLKDTVTNYDTNQTPQYGKIRDPKLDKGEFLFPLSKFEAPNNTENTPTEPVVTYVSQSEFARQVEVLESSRVVETGIGLCNENRPQSLWKQDATRAAEYVAQANLIRRVAPNMLQRVRQVSNGLITEDVIFNKLTGIISPRDYSVQSKRVLDSKGCEVQVVVTMSEKQEERLFRRNVY